MLSEPIGNDSCGLAHRWTLDPTLAQDLVLLDVRAKATMATQGVRWEGLFIISGYRTPSVQASLNPSAPRSLHTYCPSLAADLRVANQPATQTPVETWFFLGDIWEGMGHRWGGRFAAPDLNHFDLGDVLVPSDS